MRTPFEIRDGVVCRILIDVVDLWEIVLVRDEGFGNNPVKPLCSPLAVLIEPDFQITMMSLDRLELLASPGAVVV